MMTTRPTFRHTVKGLRIAAIAVLMPVITWAADAPTQFKRLDLLDGRKLTNVTVRSYDAATGKVLLIADGKAMTVPIALIPPPFAQQFKAGLLAGGASTTVVQSVPAAPSQGKSVVRATATPAPPRPATKTAASSNEPSANPAQAHAQAAADRAARFFRYELPVGSSSISVYEVSIEILSTEIVSGWEGRYRTRGKAYIQYYDSVGRSYSRQTEGFEIITEGKSGGAILVIDLSRLAHTSL